jgi:hypothetical protein
MDFLKANSSHTTTNKHNEFQCEMSFLTSIFKMEEFCISKFNCHSLFVMNGGDERVHL